MRFISWNVNGLRAARGKGFAKSKNSFVGTEVPHPIEDSQRDKGLLIGRNPRERIALEGVNQLGDSIRSI